MKNQPSRNPPIVALAASEPVSKRRQLVVGTGIAAAAALAAAAVGRRAKAPIAAAPTEPRASEGEGYRLTDHVLRYYETTRS